MRAGLAVALLFPVVLSGCGLFGSAGGGSVPDSVLPFEARLIEGEDPRMVQVVVAAAGASVDDVRESARFPVTRYCLNQFGRSDARWEIDPDTGDWAVSRSSEAMIFNARCTAR